MAPKIDRATLAQRMSLPLDAKIAMSKKRIKEWAEHWDDEVYVAFSGGKDSVVILHLVRETLGAEVPAVFFDTGLEFPEVKQIVYDTPNHIIRRPKLTYPEVIKKWGYPVVSKQVAHALAILKRPSEKNVNARNYYLTGFKASGAHSRRFMLPKKWRFLIDAPFNISERCCDTMKKQPAFAYQKESGKMPFLGEIVSESRNRLETYLSQGCNAFDSTHPKSTPLAFWSEQDVLEYIIRYKLKIATVYGEIKGIPGARYLTGEQRTGCVWCMFGAEYKGPDGLNRFQRLSLTHPKIHNHCINNLGLGKVLDHLGVDHRKPDPELEKLLA